MEQQERLRSPRKSQKKEIAVYRENPFWQPQEVKIGTKLVRIAGGMHISDEGESLSHSGIHQIKEVDEEEFVKVYTRNIKAFFDIKPTTQKVLMAVLDALQQTPNSDSIYLPWFTVEKFSEKHHLKVSRSAFHTAMRELLLKGFLAEAEEPNRYWINPHLFFNGNRMVFVNEYRKKPAEKKSKPIRSGLMGDTHLQTSLLEGN